MYLARVEDVRKMYSLIGNKFNMPSNDRASLSFILMQALHGDGDLRVNFISGIPYHHILNGGYFDTQGRYINHCGPKPFILKSTIDLTQHIYRLQSLTRKYTRYV